MVMSSSTSNEVSFLTYNPDVQPYLSVIELESAPRLYNDGKPSIINFLRVLSSIHSFIHSFLVSMTHSLKFFVAFLECIAIAALSALYFLSPYRFRTHVSQ